MFFFYKHDTSNGAFTYYVISFSQIFDSPSPICDQALSLSSPPPSIMSTLSEPPPLSLAKYIVKCRLHSGTMGYVICKLQLPNWFHSDYY